MAKPTSPVRIAVRKSTGKQNAKTNKSRKSDVNKQIKIQKALYEIADAASAVTDMQSFYKRLHEIVGEMMYAENFVIMLFDAITNTRSYPYYSDSAGDVAPPTSPIPAQSLLAELIRHPRTLHYNRQQNEEAIRRGEMFGTPSESFVGVPFKMGDQVIGGIIVQSYIKGLAYSEEDGSVLEFVAQHIAVALTRARAIEETRQRNAELQIINSVQEGLASKLDMQAIYELVGEKIRTTFNAQVVNIATYDRSTQLIQGRYYFEDGKVMPGITLPSFGFRKYVVENHRPIMINNDMSHWMEVYDNPVVQGSQSKSAIFVPMIVGNEAMGIISLQNVDQENAFTEADLRLLTTLANSMSVALENARLWEQEKLYRKALERELEIGREIQAGFLPEALPQVQGWEIAATLMSAREVAGDFYDAFELPDGNIGLVIADVCDKGVGAALFMTLFRSLIRATANLEYFEHLEGRNSAQSTEVRLRRAVSLTNNYIAETHGDSGMFATLFFGILDPRNGKLVYINGGHEPPLILQAGYVREVLHKTGSAVGAIANCRFGLSETSLQAGDIFFAFTDGVPDCRNPRGEFYGREKLVNILQGTTDSTHELIKAIEVNLREYIGGATQFDDITLLAMRRA